MISGPARVLRAGPHGCASGLLYFTLPYFVDDQPKNLRSSRSFHTVPPSKSADEEVAGPGLP
jgi:hypothetical protein